MSAELLTAGQLCFDEQVAQVSGPAPREPVTDWQITEAELRARPTRWGSLSWTSARTLIDAVNETLSGASDDLVGQLRRHWVSGPPALVERPDDESFFIIGDTGEQDASQYVVAPSLSEAVRQHGPGFVLIMSDVIYPAGHVDDYVDGVYRPYRDENPYFNVEAPLIAVPGNHDWYDGLAGFMYHFCRRDQAPPASAYTPSGWGWRALLARPVRILWRRPTPPAQATRERWNQGWNGHPNALTGPITQPGPYYAVQTKNVLVVTIDTGIDGSIDLEQGDWLREISTVAGPKILVTGKPLLVNGTRHPCWIGPKRRGHARESVWDIVHNPDHRYLATIGGDVHNFQHYVPDEAEGGPASHVVCGSGGAYMHATHSYAVVDRDSRIRNSRSHPFHSMPETSFPDQETSFGYFGQVLVPAMARMLRNSLLFLLGVLTVAGIAMIGQEYDFGTLGARTCGWAALAGIITLIVVRIISRDMPRTSNLARGVVAAGALLLGGLGSAIAYQLDPVNYPTFLVAWLGLTLAHCLFCAAIRRSGWWAPADEHAENLGPVSFGLGLIGLCVLTALLLWVANPRESGYLPAAGAVGVGAAGVIGAIWRRRRFTRIDRATGQIVVIPEAEKPRYGRANRRWYRVAQIAIPTVQSAIVLIGLFRLSQWARSEWIFTGGALGVVVAAGVLGAALLAVVVVTEVAAVLGAIGPRRYAETWGRAAGVTHHLVAPFIAVGLVIWVVIADDPVTETAAGLSLVVFPVVGALIFVAWLRQRHPRSYLYVTLGLAFVATLALVVAYRLDVQLVRTVLGTGIVMIALGISVLLGHLAFLGTFFLIRKSSHQDVTFTSAQYAEIVRARRCQPPQTPDPEIVPARVRRWARLAAPGLGEAGGPLQKGVSEIFSSDVPPFFKGFLRVDTTATELTITLHQVFGKLPSSTVTVATIPLSPRPARAPQLTSVG